MICPECGGFIGEFRQPAPPGASGFNVRSLGWPRTPQRPVPPEVERRYANDFREAVAVLPESPKASAAISRRTLQDILREKGSVTPSTFYDEIQEAIDSGSLPSWLTENLDYVRVVGNWAAHATKNKNPKSAHTGEVVEVEPGEAEFLLDVLEAAFDFWFVQPARAKAQREAIDTKQREAGKPERR